MAHSSVINDDGAAISRSSRRGFLAVGCLFVAAATFAIYYQTLSFQFVQWDDDINIYNNPNLKGLSIERIEWMFTNVQYMRRYVPLSYFTWSGLQEVQQLNPFGFHLANLVLHCCNAVLVALILPELPTSGRHSSTDLSKSTLILCTLGALMWSVHPMRVETVAWASGLLYTQSTFFLFLSFFSYLRSWDFEVLEWRRRLWFGASLICYLAATLSYPAVLGYLAVLIIYDLLRLQRAGLPFRGCEAKRSWVRKIPFAVCALIILIVTVVAQSNASGIFKPPPTLAEFGLLDRAMQSFYIWSYYLWRPFFPTGLSPLYTTLHHFKSGELRFIVSISTVVIVTTVAFLRRKKNAGFLALWACHIAFLTPMLGLTEHPHQPSDRYNYVISVIWSILFVSLGRHLIGRWGSRTAMTALLATVCQTIIIMIFAGITVRQIRVWRSSVTLFEHMVRTLGNDPYRADVYWRLAKVHVMEGRPALARQKLDELIALSPNDTGTLLFAGHQAVRLGLHDRAVTYAERALRLAPSDVTVLRSTGQQMLQAGQNITAHSLLARAVVLDPRDAESHFLLSVVLANEQRFGDAIAHIETAGSLRPDEPKYRQLADQLRSSFGSAMPSNQLMP